MISVIGCADINKPTVIFIHTKFSYEVSESGFDVSSAVKVCKVSGFEFIASVIIGANNEIVFF